MAVTATRRKVARSGAKSSPQAQFIRATAATLFARKGYAAATMDELSFETALNKGTVYYYYKSKSELLYDILSSTIDSATGVIIDAGNRNNVLEAIKVYFITFLQWIINNREQVRIYTQEGPYLSEILLPEQLKSLSSRERHYRGNVVKLLERGISSGEIENCDVQVVARVIIFTLNSTVRWLSGVRDIDAAATSIYQLLLNGLAKR